MCEEKGLDKIKEYFGIIKKTAFDWRHKIKSYIKHSCKVSFEERTESDDTFFLISENDFKHLNHSPRNRGSNTK